uniref:Uncharacterized protein n=1 Tax=Ditylenchus dipsaci TaxID=166011 RepID=A0A915EG01_9BILA
MLLTAKKKFNLNPEKGVKYMFDNGLIPESADCVANLLFECDGLKKAAIGDYLGEKADFNLEVLEFQALRTFLWHFRLPGEAQKIDRIMEQFAKHYCQHNPGTFDHQDTCYTLCYATIMLNTSLYNPSVSSKERMSLEDFIQLTSSVNVSKDLITLIYNSIRNEAFKFPGEDDGRDVSVFFQAEKQGWLSKQGMRYKTWNRRHFVLSDKCLYYFEFPNDKEPKGIIPLETFEFAQWMIKPGLTLLKSTPRRLM